MTTEQKTLVQIEAEHNERVRQLLDASKQMRQEFDMLIALAKLYRPGDRSERDRYFAIWITDLEKAYAFYKYFLHLGD